MTTITTRAGKGSPLLNSEVDANFTNLNDDKVEASGDSMTGDLSFGDGNKVILGSGSDLQLYHDGSNSFVDDNGVGNLFVRSVNGASVRLYSGGGASSNLRLLANSAGEISLYHSGSKKLDTTSTGIDVTGTVTADGLTLDGQVSQSGAAPAYTMIQTDTTDLNTRFQVNGQSLTFFTMNDALSTQTARLRINNSSGDINFYNDGGSSQDFYWDASTSRLGLGETNPSHELHIKSDSPQFRLQDSDGTDTYGDIQFNGNALALITRGGASSHGVMRFKSTNGTDTLNRLEILSNGDVLFYDDAGASGGRWDASEKSLGIGTVSPAVALDVHDSGDATIRVLSTGTGVSDDTILRSQISGTLASNYLYFGDADDNNSGQIRYVHSDDSMRFYAGDTTERLRLYSTASIFYNGVTEIGRFHSNNYFGIGTPSPAEELHINASVPTIRLQDSDGTNQYSNILHSNGLLFFYARNGSSYGTFNFVGDNGTSQDTFSQITSNAIQQFHSAAWYIRNRVDGGSLNFGVETSAGTLYYPIQMVGSSNIIKFENASGEMARFSTSGDIEFGSNQANSGAGRYLDIYNRGTDSTSFSILRLITEQVGSTSLSTSEFYKRKNGETTLWNHETSSDAYLRAGIGVTEGWRIHSSGNVLLGKSSPAFGTAGVEINQNGVAGKVFMTRSGGDPLSLNRLSTDGEIQGFYKDGTQVGSIGNDSNNLYLVFSQANNIGLAGGGPATIFPVGNTGAVRDNAIDLGYSTGRFDDIYATNGTIQTSDRNEKQDIEALSDAEQRVAVACKGLLRKFRWKSAVEEKGDDARIHFGIIAQDLQDAFTAEGLDAGRYGMFINSTWTDDETGEERSRMGVRYSELLAFIISAI